MFLDNEYTTEYYKIVNANKEKNKSFSSVRKIKQAYSYIEKHHIIPKSMGGSNTKDNLVFLTAADHFRCHQLLVLMTTGNNHGKMWSGLWRMMNKQSRNQNRDYIFTPQDYQEAKIKAATSHSNRFSGENNPYYGKKHTSEILTKMSEKKKGKSYEEIFGQEQAQAMRDRRRTEQLGLKKGKQPITTCEWCGVSGGFGIMKRWHGETCKLYNTSTEMD